MERFNFKLDLDFFYNNNVEFEIWIARFRFSQSRLS